MRRTAASPKAECCRSALSPPISSASLDLSSPPRRVDVTPCAACKILRRRCTEKCALAPFFPPTDPVKFIVVHRVFGASNIIKLLQELPEAQRADAVSSVVYEATARLRDPIYGCTGTICHLQKQVSELQAELAKAQAEIMNMQCQNTNLFEQINTQMAVTQIVEENLPQASHPFHENSGLFNLDDGNLGVYWEHL